MSPGGGQSNTVTIDWGDGSEPTTIPLSAGQDSFSATYQYQSNPAGVTSEAYTIQAVVTDEEGQTATTSATVTVSDTGPQFTATGSPAATPSTVDQGGTTTLTAEFTDSRPASDLTATINWGDGTAPSVLYNVFNEIAATSTPGQYTLSAAHEYMASGDYNVTVSLSDGTVTTTASTTVTVVHVAPTIRIEGAGNVTPDTVELMGVVSQPGASETETVTWVVTDNGSQIASGTGADFSFADANPQDVVIVSATVTDADGYTGTDSEQILIF